MDNNNKPFYKKPWQPKLVAYRMTVKYSPLEITLEFKNRPDVVLKDKDAEKWIEEMKRDNPEFNWNMM